MFFSLAAGLDPSPSTSTAQPKQKRPPVKRPAPPPPQTTSRRLMRLLEEQQDPTSAAATLSLLRQKISLPHQSRCHLQLMSSSAPINVFLFSSWTLFHYTLILENSNQRPSLNQR